jgi:hypothetical protein
VRRRSGLSGAQHVSGGRQSGADFWDVATATWGWGAVYEGIWCVFVCLCYVCVLAVRRGARQGAACRRCDQRGRFDCWIIFGASKLKSYNLFPERSVASYDFMKSYNLFPERSVALPPPAWLHHGAVTSAQLRTHTDRTDDITPRDS